MTAQPTGRRETRQFGEAVVFDRTFDAGIDEVWAAVTTSAEMRQWVGEWSGNPASGTIEFRMTAEGDDVPAETVHIDECSAPTRFRARTDMGVDGATADEWQWEITLREEAGATTLTFAQSAGGSIPMADVAPGWEYYLDRLVAYQAGEDVAAVDFERDYHPAQSAFYADLFDEKAGDEGS